MIDKTPETSRQGMRSDKNLIENTLRLGDIFWVIFVTKFSVFAEISSFFRQFLRQISNFETKLEILIVDTLQGNVNECVGDEKMG